MKFRLFLCVSLFATLLSPRAGFACSRAPSSYPDSIVTFTSDMHHVLVMLTKGTSDYSQLYRSPGLYRLDGSGDAVWGVEWFSNSVIPHSDGRYLVQLGSRIELKRARGVGHEPSHYVRGRFYPDRDAGSVSRDENGVGGFSAIAFYDNGKLLHEYKVGDLYENTDNIEYKVCMGFHWLIDSTLDENTNVFKLATTENKSFTFSITTGEILAVEKLERSVYQSIRESKNRKQVQQLQAGISEQTTEALLDIVHAEPGSVDSLDQPYLDDYDLAKKIIGIHGNTYSYFSERLKRNIELAELAVTSGDSLPVSIAFKYVDDSRIYLPAVKHNGKNYSYLPDDLKDDKRLLLGALNTGGIEIYRHAPMNLRNDREVVIRALRAELRVPNTVGLKLEDIGHIPAHFLKDDRIRRLIDAVLEKWSSSYAPPMADIHRESAYELILQNSTSK